MQQLLTCINLILNALNPVVSILVTSKKYWTSGYIVLYFFVFIRFHRNGSTSFCSENNRKTGTMKIRWLHYDSLQDFDPLFLHPSINTRMYQDRVLEPYRPWLFTESSKGKKIRIPKISSNLFFFRLESCLWSAIFLD